ncbi:MAG: hypothetical protein CMB79_13160 [Filomicrobium sp.]|nr:hypothetical protein [Filomicrobium sp.]
MGLVIQAKASTILRIISAETVLGQGRGNCYNPASQASVLATHPMLLGILIGGTIGCYQMQREEL